MKLGLTGILVIVIWTMIHTLLPMDCSKVKPAYEEGVKAGIGMTVYLINHGVTNIPIDKVVEEAWRNRKVHNGK